MSHYNDILPEKRRTIQKEVRFRSMLCKDKPVSWFSPFFEKEVSLNVSKVDTSVIEQVTFSNVERSGRL